MVTVDGARFALTPRRSRNRPATALPVLIATTNEVQGRRITQVHGDVFGLIVRARNAFSNMDAQLWWKLSDGPVSPRPRRRLHSRS
jgi:Putative heavy-metal-binding